MDIKVTITLDERTHNVLNRLIDAIGATRTKAPETDDEWTEEEKREVLEQIAAEEAANAARERVSRGKPAAAQVAEEDAPEAVEAESDADPAPKKKPTISIEELRALAADVKTKKGSADAVKKLLNAYGAKNLSGLPADKLDEFAAKLKELL